MILHVSWDLYSITGGSLVTQVLLTTNVFAPAVAGAPTKKTKFPIILGEFLSFLLCFFWLGVFFSFSVWRCSSGFFLFLLLVFLMFFGFFFRFENSLCVPSFLFVVPQYGGFGWLNLPCWRLVGRLQQRLAPVLNLFHFQQKDGVILAACLAS